VQASVGTLQTLPGEDSAQEGKGEGRASYCGVCPLKLKIHFSDFDPQAVATWLRWMYTRRDVFEPCSSTFLSLTSPMGIAELTIIYLAKWQRERATSRFSETQRQVTEKQPLGVFSLDSMEPLWEGERTAVASRLRAAIAGSNVTEKAGWKSCG